MTTSHQSAVSTSCVALTQGYKTGDKCHLSEQGYVDTWILTANDDSLTFSEDNLATPLTFSNAQDLCLSNFIAFLPVALSLIFLPSLLTFFQLIFLSETGTTLQTEEEMVAFRLKTLDKIWSTQAWEMWKTVGERN